MLYLAFSSENINYAFILTIVFGTLYGVSDEVHQLFVPGRGAMVKDVLIDSAGAIVGVGLYLVISRIMKNRSTAQL